VGDSLELIASLFTSNTVTAVWDNNGYNGVAVATLNTTTGIGIGNRGVDEELFKANAKLVKQAGGSVQIIPFKEIVFRKSNNFDTALKCNNQVLIYFPDNYKRPAAPTGTISLYLGPEAKTLGDDNTGTVGAKILGDCTAYNCIPELKYYKNYLTINEL
jgi:hypothetical protein